MFGISIAVATGAFLGATSAPQVHELTFVVIVIEAGCKQILQTWLYRYTTKTCFNNRISNGKECDVMFYYGNGNGKNVMQCVVRVAVM